MTRSGISLRLSGQGSGISEKFRYVLEAAGGSVIARTPERQVPQQLDNDAGRAALQFYVDAVQKYKIDDPKVQHDAAAFAAGTTAMLFREAWVIGEIQEKNPKLEYGVAPIPKWTAPARTRCCCSPGTIYVNGKSSNRTAAWEFLKFLTNHENSLRLTEHDRLGVGAPGRRLEAAAGQDAAVRDLRHAAEGHGLLRRADPDGVGRDPDRSSPTS